VASRPAGYTRRRLWTRTRDKTARGSRPRPSKAIEHLDRQAAGVGPDGFIEEYTCFIKGEPTRVVVTVKRNADGKAQHLVVNHRPRSSVLLFARLMGKQYAGTPLAKYFINDEAEAK
jgi:hypothetical protein